VPFTSILQASITIQIADRLPAYHRLDVSLNYRFSKKRWQHKIKVGLYNAYNQKNVFFAYDAVDFSTGEIVSKVVYGLPILPSPSYSVKF
jgi:hypothetical protein